MTPTETRELLEGAAGRRAAARLVASWAGTLRGFDASEVRRVVERWIAKRGSCPTLGDVRRELGRAA